MFNLFDILQAQGGPGLQGLGQQYGLSPEQTRKAMDALMPAFGLGLQRNAVTDPVGFGQWLSLVGLSGNGQPAPPSPSDRLVQQIFGSPHLSQAVIQQAAVASGVASPVLRQMLPLVAGMVVAGIVHLMLNQPQATPKQAPNGGAVPYGFAPGAYWSEMMRNWTAIDAPPAPTERSAPQRPAAASALPPARSKPAAAKPADLGPPDAAETPFDLFQQMFQAGLDAQQENAKAMQSLFDAFWTTPDAVPAQDRQGAPKARS